MNIEIIPISGSCLVILYFILNMAYHGYIYNDITKLSGNNIKSMNHILIKDLLFITIGVLFGIMLKLNTLESINPIKDIFFILNLLLGIIIFMNILFKDTVKKQKLYQVFIFFIASIIYIFSYINYNNLPLATQYQFMIGYLASPFIIIFYSIYFNFIEIIDIPDSISKFIYSGWIYIIYGALNGIVCKFIIMDILNNNLKIQDNISLCIYIFFIILLVPIFSRMGRLPYNRYTQIIILNNNIIISGEIHYESEDEIYVYIFSVNNSNDVKIEDIESLLIEKVCRVQKSDILFITLDSQIS